MPAVQRVLLRQLAEQSVHETLEVSLLQNNKGCCNAADLPSMTAQHTAYNCQAMH